MVMGARLPSGNLNNLRPPEQGRPEQKPLKVAGIGPIPERAPRAECLPFPVFLSPHQRPIRRCCGSGLEPMPATY